LAAGGRGRKGFRAIESKEEKRSTKGKKKELFVGITKKKKKKEKGGKKVSWIRGRGRRGGEKRWPSWGTTMLDFGPKNKKKGKKRGELENEWRQEKEERGLGELPSQRSCTEEVKKGGKGGGGGGGRKGGCLFLSEGNRRRGKFYTTVTLMPEAREGGKRKGKRGLPTVFTRRIRG